MDGSGKIYNSTFRSGMAKTFSGKLLEGQGKRMTTPGPGQYQAFSEFGIYRSKNADKFETEINKKTVN